MKQGFTGDVHIDLAAVLKAAQDGVTTRTGVQDTFKVEVDASRDFLQEVRSLVLDILKQAQEPYQP